MSPRMPTPQCRVGLTTRRDGKKIGEVSKKWLRARDTYGVEVRDDVDTVLVLAVTVAVDALAHD